MALPNKGIEAKLDSAPDPDRSVQKGDGHFSRLPCGVRVAHLAHVTPERHRPQQTIQPWHTASPVSVGLASLGLAHSDGVRRNWTSSRVRGELVLNEVKRVLVGEPVITPPTPRREAVDDSDRRSDGRPGVASPVLLWAYAAPHIPARFSFRFERFGPPRATPSLVRDCGNAADHARP